MKFSIVIPCTRPGKLALTLESLTPANQFYEDYEIVLAPNAGNDWLNKEIEAMGEKCIPKTKIVPPGEHQREMVDNWNAAISAAAGEYITLIGDDDALCYGALSRWAEIFSINPTIGYISPYFAHYGHDDLKDNRAKSIRFDKNFTHSGIVNPDEMLKRLFSFQRSTFSPTHGVVRRSILPENPVGSLFPDYYLHAVSLARCIEEQLDVFVLAIPTIIHGYSDDSSGELIISRKDIEEKWGHAPFKYSPYLGHTYHTGWLETLLRLQKEGDYFSEAKYPIDYNKFYAKYIDEVIGESCHYNNSAHLWGLLVYREDFSEEHAKAIERVLRIRPWDNHNGKYFDDWLPESVTHFENIVQAAKGAGFVHEKIHRLMSLVNSGAQHKSHTPS